ncbi:hypothetical protein [Methylorubrum populi]|nr:hypothetical protein [Methylorubrum populi]
MAHILPFPNASQATPWLSPGDRLPAAHIRTRRPAGWLGTLENLLESVRLAWWDGSALGLSRGGLEALVGLEPGDATPPRLVPVEARAGGRTARRAEMRAGAQA